ncbi:SURF1 family protein [Microbulbifer sp. 2205BS26-8]|uniref:SURF1 family protein n=1 Tax=Microbulbifer sp. 2205BS26-8 TaxID=3064386 RepID=UPI00273FE17F|nr:SURF1 family protein [Microbulbifer sp. 2205BS26-8]MDP5210993.1 SURF1 family protein [Microbulbifer sp. 2205BS26-8]
MPAKNISVPLIRNWPITLLSAGLFPVLMALGFWQLQRAGEKVALSAELNARLSAQPVTPATMCGFERYTPVRLTGFFAEDHYLLDNRTRAGRSGYEVLQVFITPQAHWLINRGWVPAPNRRERLPQVATPQGMRTINGFLYPVIESTPTKHLPEGFPERRIQSLDTQFTRALKTADEKWSVRLSADSDAALITDWHWINSGPERHRAYALQWFTMAAVLAVLWLFAATRFTAAFNDKNQE